MDIYEGPLAKKAVIEWAQATDNVFESQMWENQSTSTMTSNLGKVVKGETGDCVVFIDSKGGQVFKVVKDWAALKKLTVPFNRVFPETAQQVCGVCRVNVLDETDDSVKKTTTHALLVQKLVRGSKADKDDIDDLMDDKGFEEVEDDRHGDYYHNEDNDMVVTDIAPGHNVVKKGKKVEVFDADVYPTVNAFLKDVSW